MDLSNGNSGGFDNDQHSNHENSPSHLNIVQQAHLEVFFERYNPSPDEVLVDELAKDLGAEVDQIKYWFENMRNQTQMEVEKARMLRVANAAMKELTFLLNMNEPLWVKSSNEMGFILVPERYAEKFPRIDDLKNPYVYEKSSKDSILVMAGGMELAKMLVDSDDWAGLFPTIVTNAEILQVFEVGSFIDCSGRLQLMREEVHVLSPLVPSREFYFLRYCKQVESGEWIIVDVSIDSFGNHIPHHSPAKKFPSGCRIRELPNGCCMVTWVEHVEVEQRFQLDMLVRDIVRSNIAYGAKRWLLELQRTYEKKDCASMRYVPSTEEKDREVKSLLGRRSVMNLSNRMVESFCKVLNTQSIQNLSDHSGQLRSNIKIITYEKRTPGEPDGMMIAVAVTSIWLPVSPQNIIHFLRDEFRRNEWDVLSDGRPMRQKAHIKINGSNQVSILKTSSTFQDDTMIFQESSIDHLGGYVVFAPIDKLDVEKMVNYGADSSDFLILPSGFTISRDCREANRALGNGNVVRSEGSLLTMCYQLLVCGGEESTGQVTKSSLDTINSLSMSILDKIKVALNCSDY